MTEPERALRVFLVDDHAMFRAGVRAELRTYVDVVGEAGTVAEAVAAITATQPDVVLLDVHMPEGGGRRPNVTARTGWTFAASAAHWRRASPPS